MATRMRIDMKPFRPKMDMAKVIRIKHLNACFIIFVQAKATLGLHRGDGLADLSLEEIHEKFIDKLVVEDLKEDKEGEREGATTSRENHMLHEVCRNLER